MATFSQELQRYMDQEGLADNVAELARRLGKRKEYTTVLGWVRGYHVPSHDTAVEMLDLLEQQRATN